LRNRFQNSLDIGLGFSIRSMRIRTDESRLNYEIVRSNVWRSVIWQLAGGILATAAVLAAIGELIWWALFLNDSTNVNLAWTLAAHVSAASVFICLVVYRLLRTSRDRALVEGGRASMAEEYVLTFRLGPFVVEVQLVAILFIVALSIWVGSFRRAAIIFFLAPLAILAHELGHAVAASRCGKQNIRITIHALGGFTTYTESLSSRREQRTIAFAGPAAGVSLGIVALLLAVACPSLFASSSFRDLLFFTFGWSALNLAPIRPLDGALILETFGFRDRAISRVSIATALVAAIVAGFVPRGAPFIAFFAVLLITNLLMVPSLAAFANRLNNRIG
jgi:Zn-dependent protease